METVETSAFTRQVTGLLSPEEYRVFQIHLVRHPEAGKVIPGTGGVRKVRTVAGGHGKRGGARVYYFWAKAVDVLYLLHIHAKSEMDQLTKDQEKALAALVRKEFD